MARARVLFPAPERPVNQIVKPVSVIGVILSCQLVFSERLSSTVLKLAIAPDQSGSASLPNIINGPLSS
jgi:hypothetical protein